MNNKYELICDKDYDLIKQSMLIDFEFAVWYLKNKELSLSQFAVSVLLFNNIIDEELILKYKPFDVWTIFSQTKVYEFLFSKFDFMKYTVAKATIMIGYNFIYFQNDFLPEWELYKSAAKCNNREIYDDQLKKAKKIGCFYKILDMENSVVLDEMVKIEINELKFEFDYEFLSSIKNKKSNKFKYIEKINNFDKIDYDEISEF